MRIEFSDETEVANFLIVDVTDGDTGEVLGTLTKSPEDGYWYPTGPMTDSFADRANGIANLEVAKRKLIFDALTRHLTDQHVTIYVPREHKISTLSDPDLKKVKENLKLTKNSVYNTFNYFETRESQFGFFLDQDDACCARAGNRVLENLDQTLDDIHDSIEALKDLSVSIEHYKSKIVELRKVDRNYNVVKK